MGKGEKERIEMNKTLSRTFVILLITMMCFSILLSANNLITPVKGYSAWNGFNGPSDVFVDSAGYVYVADTLNGQVLKFDSNGNPQTFTGTTLYHPYGIGGDANYIYVASTYTHRIAVFTHNGDLQGWIGKIGGGTGGTPGTNDIQFLYPWDVAADNSGNIYVSDHDNSRVQKIDTNTGNLVWIAGNGQGSNDNQFNLCFGIACDPSGYVYVCDGNDRIQELDPSGNFYQRWGTLGFGNGQFNSPIGIAVKGTEVYVADMGNQRIQKFFNWPPLGYVGSFVWAFGSLGNGQGEFNIPHGVDLDSAENSMYVVEYNNNRIQKFNMYNLNIGKVDPSGVNYNYVGPYEGDRTYPEGSVVTLTAFATHGYVFTQWTGSLEGQTNPNTIYMDEDKDVTANFAIASVSVTPNPAYLDRPVQISGEVAPPDPYLIVIVHYPSGDAEAFDIGRSPEGKFEVYPYPTFDEVGSYSVEVFCYLGELGSVLLATTTFDVMQPQEFLVTQGDNSWVVQPIQGTMPADEFYDYGLDLPVYIAPNAYLMLAPSPIGVNQPLHVVAFLDPLPPEGLLFHGLTIDIVKPSGSHETVGPFNTAVDGAFYFDYIPTSDGQYTFRLSYPGDGYYDAAVYYQACQSLIYPITVQPGLVPDPTPFPQAPGGRQSPEFFGSGHTDYMIPDGSAIYLYEDTTTGDLSLIMHHGSVTPSCPITEISFELSGLPDGAYVPLSDDAPPGVFPELYLDAEIGVAYGDWYKSWGESDGGVISGLAGSWEITIEASLYQGHLPYVWNYWDWSSDSPIGLDLEGGPVTISAMANNLLLNPGFEDAEFGLTGWDGTDGDGGTSTYYPQESEIVPSHSGFYSCRGEETEPENLGRLYQDVTDVTSPGTSYQISGWIKTEDVTGSVVIGLDYVGEGGGTPGDGYVMEIGHVTGTQNWALWESDVFTLPDMPEDADALWFLFDFNNGAGTAWFDDVSLKLSAEVPPSGSSINVTNIVEFDAEDPPVGLWNYFVNDTEGNELTSFTLPVAGGTFMLTDPPFSAGGDFIISAVPKVGYSMAISSDVSDDSSSASINMDVENPYVTTHLTPGSQLTITINNGPAFGQSAVVGQALPTEFNYSIPPNKPIPVQATWDIDYNSDQRFDIVVNKTMAIVVNFTIAAGAGQTNTVEVAFNTFDGAIAPKQIVGNGVVTFYPITPGKPFGFKDLIGRYKIGSGAWTNLPGSPTKVNITNTIVLPLYYIRVNRNDYGKVSDTNYDLMEQQSTKFINATYPVKNVAVNKTTTQLLGGNAGTGKAALSADCTAIATMARVQGNTAKPLGIGVVTSSYFTTLLGQTAGKDIVGYCATPNTKGILAMDGYYAAPAHEIGHTYNLYTGGTNYEEYSKIKPNGKQTTGISPSEGLWRTGFDLMGTLGYQNLDFNWVYNKTYADLLSKVTSSALDPQILVVSGLIYKDGTVVLNELNGWYQIQGGEPDDIIPGDYSLKFVAADGVTVLSEISFDAPFFANIDPGVKIGEDQPNFDNFGIIPTDVTSFAFSVPYPPQTAEVKLMDNTNPTEPQEIGAVPAEEIIEVQHTNTYFTDTNFEPMNSFDVFFKKTSSQGTTLTLTATHPATYYYTFDYQNIGQTPISVPISVKIPADFKLAGTQPVRVDFSPFTYTFANGLLSLIVPNVALGQSFTLRVNLDYKLKGTKNYPASSPTTYSKGYTFETTTNNVVSQTSITALGKKVTAIGGFIAGNDGTPKDGLKVKVYKGLSEKWSTPVDGDGYYLVNVQAGGPYNIMLYNSYGIPVWIKTGINVATDTYLSVDITIPTIDCDCSIKGFVKDNFNNPVAGVTIKLKGPLGNILTTTTTTNLGGYYVFRFLLPGTYTMTITAPASFTVPETAKTARVRLGETATVNFNLIRTGP